MMNKKKLRDIQDKIMWEGGLESAFIDYGLDVPDKKITQAIEEYKAAHEKLWNLLDLDSYEEE